MFPKLAALAAWLVAIAFFGIIGGSQVVSQLIYLYDLAKANRVMQGEIIETYPQMHSTCKYRYSVEGRLYEQTGRSCGNDHVGQQITVYVSPGDPRKSVNADPRALFWNDLISYALPLAILPIFAAIIVYQRARRSVGGLWSGRRT